MYQPLYVGKRSLKPICTLLLTGTNIIKMQSKEVTILGNRRSDWIF